MARKSNDNPQSSYAKYTGLAFQLIVIILLLTFGGNYIDKYFQFHFPIFTLVLALTGMGICMYLLFKTIK